MKIIIEGTPKEIAALVVALQERQEKQEFKATDSTIYGMTNPDL